MIDTCHDCLRRAYLIAFLARRIAGLLDRPSRRPRGLLALPDDRLITAVVGPDDEAPRRCVEEFDSDAAREQIERLGCFAACKHAGVYPSPLGDLVDPPAVIFGVGDPQAVRELADRPAATIVGARAASPYGLQMARSLGRALGAAGVPVVSGLALGIDAAAHQGSLDGKGRGVAVLAGGPERPYPRTNRGLYEQLARTGAVISELPPGSRAFKWSFPARNRIMAGLAEVTVLVEAADPSGSLITAEFARDLGRSVGAVPGRATASVSAGTNALIRDGAAVITSAEDLLDELYGAGIRPDPANQPEPATRRRQSRARSQDAPDDPQLRLVLAAVEAGHGVDGVAQAAGIGAGAARAALGALEADGYIARTGLGAYERRPAMA
jgi:DNA processing protein